MGLEDRPTENILEELDSLHQDARCYLKEVQNIMGFGEIDSLFADMSACIMEIQIRMREEKEGKK